MITTVITIVAVALAIVFAALALRPRRRWMIVPAAAIVALAIALPLALGLPRAEQPWAATLIATGFGALGVLGGSTVVALVLRFAQGSVTLGVHGGIVVFDDPKADGREILRGGTTIGYLERLALLGTVAVGQFAGIAVIVAIKGLGRFSELEGSEARERFIIGTLTSLSWAGACAAAAGLLA